MTKDKRLLIQLLKIWAQDHDHNYIISDPDPSEKGLAQTSSHLTWLVQKQSSGIDLCGLLDRLELFIENIRNPKFPDGMFCRKCQSFYSFAESNQEDGSLICYSCRNSPY